MALRLHGRGRAFLRALFIALISYLLAEAGYTIAVRNELFGLAPPPLILERGGGSVEAHPVFGYVLPRQPFRFAYVKGGKVEYEARIAGNNLGFDDPDDFAPARVAQETPRWAVFGDSYTASWFLEHTWPDVVEQLAEDAAAPLDLMNFGVAGGGICNWWSTFVHHLAEEPYELDGVVFAIMKDDMKRGFVVMETAGAFLGVRYRPFDDLGTPGSLQLPKRLRPMGLYVSPEAFEKALREGRYAPWRPYLLHAVQNAADITRHVVTATINREKWDAARLRMASDIAAIGRARGWKVSVVQVPLPAEIVEQQAVAPEIAEFSAMLGVEPVHGALAFVDPPPANPANTLEVVERCYFHHDGHWNQEGAAQFGAFMWRLLRAASPEPIRRPAVWEDVAKELNLSSDLAAVLLAQINDLKQAQRDLFLRTPRGGGASPAEHLASMLDAQGDAPARASFQTYASREIDSLTGKPYLEAYADLLLARRDDVFALLKPAQQTMLRALPYARNLDIDTGFDPFAELVAQLRLGDGESLAARVPPALRQASIGFGEFAAILDLDQEQRARAMALVNAAREEFAAIHSEPSSEGQSPVAYLAALLRDATVSEQERDRAFREYVENTASASGTAYAARAAEMLEARAQELTSILRPDQRTRLADVPVDIITRIDTGNDPFGRAVAREMATVP